MCGRRWVRLVVVLLLLGACARESPEIVAREVVAVATTVEAGPPSTDTAVAQCPPRAGVASMQVGPGSLLDTPLAAESRVGTLSVCLYRGTLRPVVSAPADTPPWCAADSYVTLGVAETDVFGSPVFSGPVFPLRLLSALPPGETASGVVEVLGAQEARLWFVLAQVSSDVISAEVEFPSNPAQPMAIHDGVAFAVAPIKSQILMERSTITLRTRETAVQIQPVFAHRFGSAAPQPRRGDCLEPLPAGEAPVDADAARATIVDAIQFVFAAAKNDQPFDSAFDDATGLADLLHQVRSGTFASHAKGVRVDVRAVSFTAPDRAVARVDLTNIPPVTDNLEFVRMDDAWKMSFASFCRLIGRTGAARCP